jgi:hypothetical protein
VWLLWAQAPPPAPVKREDLNHSDNFYIFFFSVLSLFFKWYLMQKPNIKANFKVEVAWLMKRLWT